MKRLDNFEIKVREGFELKGNIKSVVNSMIDNLNDNYAAVGESEVGSDEFSVWYDAFMVQLSKFDTVLSFLHLSKLIDKKVYDFYFEQAYNMFSEVQDKRVEE